MITSVYRSRPIGASLLCLTLKSLHTGAGWLGVVMASYLATGCTVLVLLNFGI